MEESKNDKVWVTISRTINLGNYENVKIDCGMSQTINEGEAPINLIENIQNELSANLLSFTKKTKEKNELRKRYTD
jgi:hypothetical protein